METGRAGFPEGRSKQRTKRKQSGAGPSKMGSWVTSTQWCQESIGNRARLLWGLECVGLRNWVPCVCIKLEKLDLERESRNQEVAVK